MFNFKKYTSLFWIYFRTSLSRDISFRFSFFMGIIGAFCFVGLNFFMIYFFFQKINIGRWSEKEMLVLLGNFFILYYSIFFFFWRGLTGIIKNIRNGTFDYYLVKPADSQFLVSILGGGVHNFFAILFGICVTIYGVVHLSVNITLVQLLFTIFTDILAILDFYSFVLLLVLLNFKYGYIEEVISFAFSAQDVSRYPMEAFMKLPIYLLVIILPFSALTTIPSRILIDTIFPTVQTSLFVFFSILFILFVRKCWFFAVRDYSSSN